MSQPILTGTAVAAEARAVTKIYGEGAQSVRALDDVSVVFATGTFTAVMGPSGSGKSTLLHALAAVDSIDDGRVFVAGMDVTAMTEQERTLLRRDHIGFVFQSFNLIPMLTARENIMLPLDLAKRRADQEWFARLVSMLRLQDRLEHLPRELSGGQQQRVAVARALAARPELILADEPTGNLDSGASDELLRFLGMAVRDLGQTIAMVTHDPVAASHADRVLFLVDGRIVDDLGGPTVDTVLAMMKRLESGRRQA